MEGRQWGQRKSEHGGFVPTLATNRTVAWCNACDFVFYECSVFIKKHTHLGSHCTVLFLGASQHPTTSLPPLLFSLNSLPPPWLPPLCHLSLCLSLAVL